MNEGSDAPKKVRRRRREVGKSGKKDRQGIGDLRSAHGTRIMVNKPGIDARLVEDVISLTSDVMNCRRRDGVQTNRTFFAGTVEMTQGRMVFGRRHGQGTGRPALGHSLAPGHFFLYLFF